MSLHWKIGAGLALALLIALSGFTGYQMVENGRLTAANQKLDAEIRDPDTGYLVRLERAEGNAALALEANKLTIERLRAKATYDAEALRLMTARIAAIQLQNQKLQDDARRIMATPPRGGTLEERVRDIDSRVLESLK